MGAPLGGGRVHEAPETFGSPACTRPAGDPHGRDAGRCGLGRVPPLAGELDDAPAAARALFGALAQIQPPGGLYVELSGVQSFTAPDLTALLLLREAAEKARVAVGLVAPSATVRQVLELTGTRRLFTVSPRTASDLTACGSAALGDGQPGPAGPVRPNRHDRGRVRGAGADFPTTLGSQPCSSRARG